MLFASDVKRQESDLQKWLGPHADACQIPQLPVSLNHLLVCPPTTLPCLRPTMPLLPVIYPIWVMPSERRTIKIMEGFKGTLG